MTAQPSFAGTQERIPLLGEVLSLVGGRVPIILELKRGRNNRLLCERAYEIICAYEGDLCVESFDPMIVRWFRRHAPEVLRGQLSCTEEAFGKWRSYTQISSSEVSSYQIVFRISPSVIIII